MSPKRDKRAFDYCLLLRDIFGKDVQPSSDPLVFILNMGQGAEVISTSNIDRVIKKLNERERTALIERYNGKTLREIAAKTKYIGSDKNHQRIGVSSEKVRQILARALHKLRRSEATWNTN
jgi:hypothetical protein